MSEKPRAAKKAAARKNSSANKPLSDEQENAAPQLVSLPDIVSTSRDALDGHGAFEMELPTAWDASPKIELVPQSEPQMKRRTFAEAPATPRAELVPEPETPAKPKVELRAETEAPAERKPEPVPKPKSAATSTPVINEPLFGDEFADEKKENKSANPYVASDKIVGSAKRKSGLQTSMSAFTYINNLAKDDDVRIRDSDRTTSILLFSSVLLTAISLFLPQLAPHRFGFILICDAMVGVTLLYYVFNRFGILNTLTPRQALLTWQLIMGGAFLGVFVTINLAVAIAVMVAQHGLR